MTARRTRHGTQAAGPGHNSGDYAVSRFNALRHGVLSRYTVLPWEDVGEYDTLLFALVEEHKPQGPTEEHLVEELAGILWRKRRLRLAEAATVRDGLRDTTESFKDTAQNALVCLGKNVPQERVADAISANPDDTERDFRDLDDDKAHTERALEILRRGGKTCYERAVKALREDTRDYWQGHLEGEYHDPDEGSNPWQPTPVSLGEWLDGEIRRWYEEREAELQHRNEIREQAFGQAYTPGNSLVTLARYEVHLDRKLERTLAMLLRLQDLRRQGDAA